MSSCPQHRPEPEPRRSRAESMVQRLPRFGFSREPLLDDDLGVELTVYVRDTTNWRDVVMVYTEQAVRAYRRRTDPEPGHDLGPDVGRYDGPEIDPADVVRLIPLGDAVSVVDEVLGWPAEEPDKPAAGADRPRSAG